MKRYRVWFMDGSALEVEASNDDEAISRAEHIAKRQSFRHSTSAWTAKRVEYLGDSEPIS